MLKRVVFLAFLEAQSRVQEMPASNLIESGINLNDSDHIRKTLMVLMTKKSHFHSFWQRDEYLRRAFRRRIDSNLETSLFLVKRRRSRKREERRMSSKGFKRDTSALLQES